jgi:hypothetical protein
MMTEDIKGIEGIAEGARDFFGGAVFDNVSAKGLILTVLGQGRFEEKAAELTYLFWCAQKHI